MDIRAPSWSQMILLQAKYRKEAGLGKKNYQNGWSTPSVKGSVFTRYWKSYLLASISQSIFFPIIWTQVPVRILFFFSQKQMTSSWESLWGDLPFYLINGLSHKDIMDSDTKYIFKKETFSLWNILWRQLSQFLCEPSQHILVLEFIQHDFVKSFIY